MDNSYFRFSTSSLEEKILDLIKRNLAIVKVIKSDIYNQRQLICFIEELLDPAYARPSRSNWKEKNQWYPRSGPNQTTPLPGTIYNQKKTVLNKKNSVSLLPSNGQMQLYTSGIGFIFNLEIIAEHYREQNKKIDKYTYVLNAYSSGSSKKRLQKASCKSIDVLINRNKEAVKSNSYIRHNEIILGESLDSWIGLFATENLLVSRLNLIYHKYFLQHRLSYAGIENAKIPLVILQYNKDPLIYTFEKQLQDLKRGMSENNDIALLINKKWGELIARLSGPSIKLTPSELEEKSIQEVNEALLSGDYLKFKRFIDGKNPKVYLKNCAARLIFKTEDPLLIIRLIDNALNFAKHLSVYKGGYKAFFGGFYYQKSMISTTWAALILQAQEKILSLARGYNNDIFEHPEKEKIEKFLARPVTIHDHIFGNETFKEYQQENINFWLR